MSENSKSCLYGLAAEFEDSDSLKRAAQEARDAGYNDMQAFTPYHVEGLTDILGYRYNKKVLPALILIAIAVGALVAFILQYWTSVVNYPLNIAGLPFNSWPAYIPVIFELGVLFAAVTALVALLVPSGLPLPYHPVFNAPNIELASRNHFFLCVRSTDRHFDFETTQDFLQSLEPVTVSEIQC